MVLMLFSGCINRYKNEKVSNNLAKPLFFNTSIQDSLNTFISELDSFPNPWNAPVIHSILVSESQKDTFITFSTCFDVTFIETPQAQLNKAGMVSNKNDLIIIKYYGNIREMKNYIDESLISEALYDSLKTQMRHLWDKKPIYPDWDYSAYFKVYHLKKDSLLLVGRYSPRGL